MFDNINLLFQVAILFCVTRQLSNGWNMCSPILKVNAYTYFIVLGIIVLRTINMDIVAFLIADMFSRNWLSLFSVDLDDGGIEYE